MNLKNTNQNTKNESVAEQTTVSRRTLAKGITASALLTSVSSSAWANYCSVSGQISGNLSLQNTGHQCGHCLIPPGFLTAHQKFVLIWELIGFHFTAHLSEIFPSHAQQIQDHWEAHYGKGVFASIQSALADTTWSSSTCVLVNIMAWNKLHEIYNKCRLIDDFSAYEKYHNITSCGFFVDTSSLNAVTVANHPQNYQNFSFANHVNV